MTGSATLINRFVASEDKVNRSKTALQAAFPPVPHLTACGRVVPAEKEGGKGKGKMTTRSKKESSNKPRSVPLMAFIHWRQGRDGDRGS